MGDRDCRTRELSVGPRGFFQPSSNQPLAVQRLVSAPDPPCTHKKNKKLDFISYLIALVDIHRPMHVVAICRYWLPTVQISYTHVLNHAIKLHFFRNAVTCSV